MQIAGLSAVEKARNPEGCKGFRSISKTGGRFVARSADANRQKERIYTQNCGQTSSHSKPEDSASNET